MTPIVYKSTDASAPVMNGLNGSMLDVLDACLVNGYGSKAPLGWGKPFSATNGGVYRAPTGNRHYVQISDSFGTGSNVVARMCAFESMSNWNLGTGQFPTTTQFSGGVYCFKSGSNDATARAWTLVGDDRTFYLTVNNNGGSSGQSTLLWGFGEFESYKQGDAFNTFVAGANGATSISNCGLDMPGAYGSASGGAGLYVARSFSQIGSAVNPYVSGPLSNTALLGSSGITYPNGPDGGLYVGPVFLCETAPGTPIRGRLRGLYAPMHNQPLTNYDVATNVQGLPGLTLMAVYVQNNNTVGGQVLFDITGPW